VLLGTSYEDFLPQSKGKGKGHPRTGHEGPEGDQLYSSTLPSTSALDGGGWSAPRPGRFTLWKDPVPIVQEAGWTPVPFWTGAENLATTGIRSPDRPARNELLYRLSYRGPVYRRVSYKNLVTIVPVRATKTCGGSGGKDPLIFGTRRSGDHHVPAAFSSGKPHYPLIRLLWDKENRKVGRGKAWTATSNDRGSFPCFYPTSHTARSSSGILWQHASLARELTSTEIPAGATSTLTRIGRCKKHLRCVLLTHRYTYEYTTVLSKTNESAS
jgi:hypothetical protein